MLVNEEMAKDYFLDKYLLSACYVLGTVLGGLGTEWTGRLSMRGRAGPGRLPHWAHVR